MNIYYFCIARTCASIAGLDMKQGLCVCGCVNLLKAQFRQLLAIIMVIVRKEYVNILSKRNENWPSQEKERKQTKKKKNVFLRHSGRVVVLIMT